MKKEEEEKIAGMKDKIKELSAEVLSLKETIIVIQEQLKGDEMVLLKVCARTTHQLSVTVHQNDPL